MKDTSFGLRTPLARVRGLGPAHHGTEHFWLQRLTAVANLILVFAFVGVLIALVGKDYAGARALLAHPLVGLLLGLFIISFCIHMRIGMQVVIEDYVHGEAAKIAALILNTFFAFGVGAASIYAILKLAFGNS